MNETQSLRLGLFVVLSLLISYLTAFFVWAWFKVNAPSQASTPEQPQLKATPQGLEHETALLIQQSTGKTARVCEGADKGLVDIEILDKAGQITGIVQCVPLTLVYSFTPGNVQALYQVKRSQHVKAAYLVTKGRFEYAVQLEAKRLGIKLLDGVSLQRMHQRINQTPLVIPADEMPADDSRWQRPGAPVYTPARSFSDPQPRHVFIPHTPTVVVPRDDVEPAEAYTPSVRSIPSDEIDKPMWPAAASHRRNLPSVIIKPIPLESPSEDIDVESPEFQQAQQMLQARKYKLNRTTLLKRAD